MVDSYVDNVISATNLMNSLVVFNMENIQRLADSAKEYWRVGVENAKAIATWLEKHPSVEKVNYAALASSPWHALANKYAPKGPGAVLSFELKGGVAAGKKFVESLKLFSHVANIGDVRSLVIHPATTTHSQLSAEEQLAAGVTPGLVRLSLGIENVEDLKADLEVGFAAAK